MTWNPKAWSPGKQVLSNWHHFGGVTSQTGGGVGPGCRVQGAGNVSQLWSDGHKALVSRNYLVYLRFLMLSWLVTVGLRVRDLQDATHVGRVPISWFNFPFLNGGSPGADLTCSGFYFDPGDYSMACSILCESLCQRSHHLRVPRENAKIYEKCFNPPPPNMWKLGSFYHWHLGSLSWQPSDRSRWGKSGAKRGSKPWLEI